MLDPDVSGRPARTEPGTPLGDFIEHIAQTMADYANRDRLTREPYESPGVEPYEHDAEDFWDLAEVVAASLDDPAVVLRVLLERDPEGFKAALMEMLTRSEAMESAGRWFYSREATRAALSAAVQALNQEEER